MRDELKQLITDSVPKMEGWCSEEKAIAMAELVLESFPKVVVEIGVFGGRSLVPQAMALREMGTGVVYGIDPWQVEAATEGDNGEENNKWWKENMKLNDIHQLCMTEIWKHKLDPHCIVIRACSQHCVGLFRKIDILHIDGNHSELTSCRDVQLYGPKVRKGGFIWFDDTDWSTTKAAVKLMEEMADKIREVGACSLYRKR